jgi:hypothetical protein
MGSARAAATNALTHVCYWHLAGNSAAPFWSLTAQSGQWPEQALNSSAAFDPKRTCWAASRAFILRNLVLRGHR